MDAQPPATPTHEAQVRSYYEANTAAFARWDGRKRPLPIHRQVWAPGVTSLEAALDFVHHQLKLELGQCAAAVDLGCGVGATLQRLFELCGPDKQLTGLTLSPYQVDQAKRTLDSHITVRLGSYTNPADYPVHQGPTLFYAVESLVHATRAQDFVATVSARAQPGDRLAVCDDFLAHQPTSRAERRLAAAFADGWLAPDWQVAETLKQSLADQGWALRVDKDWSPWMPQGFWRTIASRLALALPGQAAWVKNFRGGAALVLGYPRGVFTYRYLVWERVA